MGTRAAGQHARERANALTAWLIGAVAVSVAVLALAWLAFGGHGSTLILIELGAIGAMVAAHRLLGPRVDRWLQGAQGEESVGAAIAELEAQGWRAVHGVSLGRGDVDHTVVGPGGVFAVETKSRRGRIGVDRIDRRWLNQAYAERKLLERVTGRRVEALLVFSDAWLVGSVPARRQGVTILPARMLAGYLERRRPVMSAREASDVAERLAAAVA